MTNEKQRKKKLIRDYKESTKAMGAYCVRNTRNQQVFVGVSRDVEARMNRHRFMLRTGSEDIAELQKDWNRLGADAFEFSVLEVLEPPENDTRYDPTEDLQLLKDVWCEQLQAFAPSGYNSAPKA